MSRPHKLLFTLVFIGFFLFPAIGGLSAQEGGDIRSQLAQTASSLQDIQFQQEAIKSAIDANGHLIKAETQNMDLRIREIEARLSSLEERLSIQGRQVTSAVSSVAPEAAAEAELYQEALDQVNRSEFLKAIATLKNFNKKFPKSTYIGNAQYWIGECYFAMRDFEQSIKEFQVLVEKYPRSEKVPSALLKQGYAFIELDMESDSKLFFDGLIRKYPHSKEAKEAKDYIKRTNELKKAQKANAAGKYSGSIPLASGVEEPEKKSKNTPSKYR